MSFKEKSKQMTFADMEVLHNENFINKRLNLDISSNCLN